MKKVYYTSLTEIENWMNHHPEYVFIEGGQDELGTFFVVKTF